MRLLRGVPTGAALLILSCFQAYASPTPHQLREADRYSRFGSQALKSGNVNKARGLFGKALKILPSFPDAHVGMGHVAMGERKFEEAFKEYNLALEAYVGFSDALFDLQLVHYTEAKEQTVKLRDQIMSFRRLLGSQALGNSAWIERKITEIEEEIHQLEMVKPPTLDAIREAPGEVHFYVGNALFNLNRLDDAVGEWEACARKSPKFPLVHNNLAVAYWKKGLLDKAISSLSTAERLGLPVNTNFKADLERSAAQHVSSAALSSKP